MRYEKCKDHRLQSPGSVCCCPCALKWVTLQQLSAPLSATVHLLKGPHMELKSWHYCHSQTTIQIMHLVDSSIHDILWRKAGIPMLFQSSRQCKEKHTCYKANAQFTPAPVIICHQSRKLSIHIKVNLTCRLLELNVLTRSSIGYSY